MAWWETVLTTESGDLNLSPGVHTLEGERQIPASCPLTSTGTGPCAYVHITCISQVRKLILRKERFAVSQGFRGIGPWSRDAYFWACDKAELVAAWMEGREGGRGRREGKREKGKEGNTLLTVMSLTTYPLQSLAAF